MIETDYSNTCISIKLASQEVSVLVLRIFEDFLICHLLIEKQVVLLDHLDEELVVATNVGNVLRSCLAWSEDIRPDCDSHVVRSHLVIWLMLNYHPEHFDVELQSVKIDLRQLVDPVLELKQCEYQLNILVRREWLLIFNLRDPEKLVVEVVRDQWVFH